MLLDKDVTAELLVVEDWAGRGVVRKIPAAAAPTTTISITIKTRRDDCFVLSR